MSNSSDASAVNIVLIGAPGSGKGTQSTRLTERYQICQISTGDLLRQAIQDKASPEGEQIRQVMQSGGLVSDNIVLSLIDKNMNKSECENGVLFDGFPRTINQGEQLDKLLESKNRRINAVLEYAIEDDLLTRRILGRLVHKASGRSYHEEFNPPKESMKDDITGEPLERRSDDTTETLSARLQTYHKQTTPLIDFYRQRNLHRTIDATQKVSEVSRQSFEFIDQLNQQSTSSPTVRSVEKLPAETKSKVLPNQLDLSSNRLSNNFLFIYNSVTSVLRDRGII